MTDLREGVTANQHAILDLVERSGPDFRRVWSIEDRVRWAFSFASTAQRDPDSQFRLQGLNTAAAILIDVADELAGSIAPAVGEGSADARS